MIVCCNYCFFISAAGFVERVVLLGGPISIKDEKWEDARKVCLQLIPTVFLPTTFVL